MRKIFFLLVFSLLFFKFIPKAHADFFQDVFNNILGGGDPRFPNAALDGGGYLPATADFCPVCPLDEPGALYLKSDPGGNQQGLLGCYRPAGGGDLLRIGNLGSYEPKGINCKSTTYKFCGNSGLDSYFKPKGCCKDSALTDCVRDPSNPNPPPPPGGDKCLRCPTGTFWDTRQIGFSACYYPRNDPSHNPAEYVSTSSDDSACTGGLICDKTYLTGCHTQDEINNLRDHPPTAYTGPTNSPLSSPCKDPGPEGCTRIKTAFGNVSTSAEGFTRWLLGFVLSISGGIVVLIIIISGYRLMTSQGDPEKVKNARDQLTAAIVGLLFIIFSLVILELITKDILGLPGFGG